MLVASGKLTSSILHQMLSAAIADEGAANLTLHVVQTSNVQSASNKWIPHLAMFLIVHNIIACCAGMNV